jgi:hypothetical protein
MCALELLLCKLVIYVQELNACNPAHGCALGVALCYCGYLCIRTYSSSPYNADDRSGINVQH